MLFLRIGFSGLPLYSLSMVPFGSYREELQGTENELKLPTVRHAFFKYTHKIMYLDIVQSNKQKPCENC